MMMRSVKRGSVHTLLKMARQKKVLISWKICLTVALDAAEAVHYLHKLEPQILHRDLKAENLLLTNHFRCKLTDFGLSRSYDGGAASKMTVCGTPCWPVLLLHSARAENALAVPTHAQHGH